MCAIRPLAVGFGKRHWAFRFGQQVAAECLCSGPGMAAPAHAGDAGAGSGLQASLADHFLDPAVDVLELFGCGVLADECDDGLGVTQCVLEQLPHSHCLAWGPVVGDSNLNIHDPYGAVPAGDRAGDSVLAPGLSPRFAVSGPCGSARRGGWSCR